MFNGHTLQQLLYPSILRAHNHYLFLVELAQEFSYVNPMYIQRVMSFEPSPTSKYKIWCELVATGNGATSVLSLSSFTVYILYFKFVKFSFIFYYIEYNIFSNVYYY